MIVFAYRQIFAFFFLLSFSIISILDFFRGRETLEYITTVLLISFGYGVLGLIVNFLLRLILTREEIIEV